MHIPDGYLSPKTWVPLLGVTIPLLGVAANRAQRTLRTREAPLLAMAAAFVFVTMMFNIPIPGGTSGHPVGAVVAAILLGPWNAAVAVSVALTIQAFLFGDGGITALGANCFNMAIVMPFTGWWCYRLLAGASPSPRRRLVAASVAGYVGINAAALAAGVEFGIQPLIAAGPDGHPLYAPYPLAVALPAMALQHLLFFGFVEAAATGYAVRWFYQDGAPVEDRSAVRPGWRLGRVVLVLALLSPIGLILPARFGAGTAWGEWSGTELTKMLGYLPEGMRGTAGIWSAPLPGYGLAGGASGNLVYLACALAGVAATAGLIMAWARGTGGAAGK